MRKQSKAAPAPHWRRPLHRVGADPSRVGFVSSAVAASAGGRIFHRAGCPSSRPAQQHGGSPLGLRSPWHGVLPRSGAPEPAGCQNGARNGSAARTNGPGCVCHPLVGRETGGSEQNIRGRCFFQPRFLLGALRRGRLPFSEQRPRLLLCGGARRWYQHFGVSCRGRRRAGPAGGHGVLPHAGEIHVDLSEAQLGKPFVTRGLQAQVQQDGKRYLVYTVQRCCVRPEPPCCPGLLGGLALSSASAKAAGHLLLVLGGMWKNRC